LSLSGLGPLLGVYLAASPDLLPAPLLDESFIEASVPQLSLAMAAAVFRPCAAFSL